MLENCKCNGLLSNRAKWTVLATVGLLILQTGTAKSQTINSDVSGSFTNASQVGTLDGVITQMAFDPNDPGSLYLATWFNGVWRFDYQEGGALSNGSQVVDASAGLDENGSNGSYGIAFHDDPVLNSVMYLSRAFPNTPVNPRGQGLGAIVRLNDADGDGIWGNGNDLNQTIVENIYVADWTHQINQFAVFGDSLYIGIGTMTNNGGVDFNGIMQGDPGESAHTGAVVFIEDLTVHSNDTTSTNAAWFEIGDDVDAPADVVAFKTDTNAFTSSDPGKLRVFSTGLRNVYGVGVNREGELWVTGNQGGETVGEPDELFQSSYQDDHGFNKANDEVGDWKDPANPHPSAQAAQMAGFFQGAVTPVGLMGSNTAVTGLDFVDATDNVYDGHVLVSRHSNGGQDVVLVDPDTGVIQQLLERQNGVRPTDVLVDPFGDILVSYSTNQIRFVEVVVPVVTEPLVATVGIDFGGTAPVDPNTSWNSIMVGGDATSGGLAAGGETIFTDSQTGTPGGGYASFSGLSTDGSGSLTVILTGESLDNNPDSVSQSNAAHVILAAVTLTAVEASGGACPSGFEVGDVNQDGMVDLLDVGPFVDLITSGIFLCEGDIDGNGFVDLLDVAPFVAILTGG